jgi:hypothetical protein
MRRRSNWLAANERDPVLGYLTKSKICTECGISSATLCVLGYKSLNIGRGFEWDHVEVAQTNNKRATNRTELMCQTLYTGWQIKHPVHWLADYNERGGKKASKREFPPTPLSAISIAKQSHIPRQQLLWFMPQSVSQLLLQDPSSPPQKLFRRLHRQSRHSQIIIYNSANFGRARAL